MGWIKDNWTRAFNPIGPELSAKISSDINRWDISGKRAGARRAEEGKANARQAVENIPGYNMPDEALALQKLYEDTGSGLREQGQEIQSIAGAKMGMARYAGTSEKMNDLRQTQRAAVQDVGMLAGSSGSFAGAISQLGGQQTSAMRNIAVQNQQYRDQSQVDYMQALQQRAGLEAQATGMEVSGLQTMISEKDKIYQSELEKVRAEQQLEISFAGAEIARS